MRPRAFVVMPFGVKSPGETDRQQTVSSSEKKINFDGVYDDLLKPALERAGYEIARADSANSAGDIRTDMYFELVTADLVVADVSILNPNHYCPVKSQIDSIGCRSRLNRLGSLRFGKPVKLAFFQKV